MRVDASQVLAGGGVKVKSGTNSVTDSLKEGDEAGLKSADDDLSVGEKSLVRGFNDKSLAPYAAKLAELNMPVTEESARTMRDLVAQHPNMSMDEAAFLASNKLTGDDSLMKAALDVLSGGDKTDAMIAKLLSTLSEHEPATPDPGFRSVSAQTAAPLTELITFIAKNVSTLATIITQPDDNMQLNVKNTEEFFAKSVESDVRFEENIPKTDVQTTQNTQNTTVAQPGEQLPQSVTQNEIPAQGQTQGQVQGQEQQVQEQQTHAPAASTSQTQQVPAEQISQERPLEETQVPKQTAELQQQEKAPETQQTQESPKQALAPSLSNTVAELLSEVPQFKGTPHSALERFSNMLLRVASDSGAASEADKALATGADNDTKLLAAQLNKMFTKIGRNDADAGMRLREAREELFARLSLIEEEISRATGPAKAELLTQTQKLMDHVKLLNNIDQFTYMQLPVQLNEKQQKAAELYVFKRKGGKRADPDNVNILLSIDLEYMGHWEALLNIKGKDVYINMEVQGEKEKDHFIEQTVLLHDMLNEEGFKLVNTNIKISKEETTPLTALLALDRYTGGHQGKIDFFY